MASEKIAQLIEEVKVLSVLELSELVHALEEEFGVSAAAATGRVFADTLRRYSKIWRLSPILTLLAISTILSATVPARQSITAGRTIRI